MRWVTKRKNLRRRPKKVFSGSLTGRFSSISVGRAGGTAGGPGKLIMGTPFMKVSHSGEDVIAFPWVRVKMPGEPVDQLRAHHEQMQEILNRINPLLEKAESGARKS